MGLSTTHLIIFLVIVVLIFGTKKLKNIGADLGDAVRNFKDGMKGEGEKATQPAVLQQDASAQKTGHQPLDVEAKSKV